MGGTPGHPRGLHASVLLERILHRITQHIAEPFAEAARHNHRTARLAHAFIQQMHRTQAQGFIVVFVHAPNAVEHVSHILLTFHKDDARFAALFGLRLERHSIVQFARQQDVTHLDRQHCNTPISYLFFKRLFQFAIELLAANSDLGHIRATNRIAQRRLRSKLH